MSGIIRAKGGTAVMARRAPAEVEADSELEALYRRLDYFPTPPWAARAGAELLLSIDPNATSVWEPACGEGHMAAALADYFDVFASDVHPFGFGEVVDFLGDVEGFEADWIMTNPPFKVAEHFVRLGLERARRGIILLLRLPFLESEQRFELLYGDQPLTILAPFAERVAMSLGKWDPSVTSATAYAFFVWQKGVPGPAIIQPIPYGAKVRYSRLEDAANFGFRRDAPMLDAMEAA